MKALKLRICWSKRENDFVVYYPRKADGGWILDAIIKNRMESLLDKTVKDMQLKHWNRICGVDWNKYIGIYEVNFIKELEERGFDKTTLKFEVQIDLTKLENEFPHIWDELSSAEKKKINRLLKERGVKKSTK